MVQHGHHLHLLYALRINKQWLRWYETEGRAMFWAFDLPGGCWLQTKRVWTRRNAMGDG